MKTPARVRSLSLECTCVGTGIRTLEKYMKDMTRADKMKINRLVREHLPDLAYDLMLTERPLKDLYWFNPYNYYKTKRHLILVQSSIEYFIRYN
ncbi:MAG TPA: hypothetical protein DCL77_01740 [Prolixibacteraceae bacterium]|jgi:hypothetical protein|nr:hypothetical protein [Prolixibacteraceae bacterium]